jgi:DNA-binding Lrp family transcriptional regulator
MSGRYDLAKGDTGRSILAGGESVEAFVLITVPANNSGGIVRRLLNDHKESVTEAAAVYGEADVIARVKAPSILALHELIMGTIQNLPNVLVTRTFIIIPPPYAEG